MTGVWVVLAALAVAGAIAVAKAIHDGRFRVKDTGDVVTADDLAAPLGTRATLVQFSSSFCAPCRATRVLLADVVTSHPDVAHVEIDAEAHLELVRRLDVLRTPTVLVLDGDGVIRGRASGVPRRDQVESALASVPGPR